MIKALSKFKANEPVTLISEALIRNDVFTDGR